MCKNLHTQLKVHHFDQKLISFSDRFLADFLLARVTINDPMVIACPTVVWQLLSRV